MSRGRKIRRRRSRLGLAARGGAEQIEMFDAKPLQVGFVLLQSAMASSRFIGNKPKRSFPRFSRDRERREASSICQATADFLDEVRARLTPLPV